MDRREPLIEGHQRVDFAEFASALRITTAQIIMTGAVGNPRSAESVFVVYTPGPGEDVVFASLERDESGVLQVLEKREQPEFLAEVRRQVQEQIDGAKSCNTLLGSAGLCSLPLGHPGVHVPDGGE